MDTEEIDRRRLADLVEAVARLVVADDGLSALTMSAYAKERRDGKTKDSYDSWMEGYIRRLAVYNAEASTAVCADVPLRYPSAEDIARALRVCLAGVNELRIIAECVPFSDPSRKRVECDVMNGVLHVTMRVHLGGYLQRAKSTAVDFVRKRILPHGFGPLLSVEEVGDGDLKISFSKGFFRKGAN